MCKRAYRGVLVKKVVKKVEVKCVLSRLSIGALWTDEATLV